MQVSRQRHTPLAIFHWIGQSVGPAAGPGSVEEGRNTSALAKNGTPIPISSGL
jgi:hypothetical protein